MNSLAITLLAGGVGGAKAAEGLAKSPYASGLTIIGNVGDDQVFHGLWVSPDIDTLVYTLSGRIDRAQGWGLAGDGRNVLTALNRLGVDTWMQLGDMDFATHLYRTEQRRLGERPQTVAERIARANGVDIPILLPTEDALQTTLRSGKQWFNFQDYFVRLKCQPEIDEIRYTGADKACPTPEAMDALIYADLIVIAPSNPLLSIGAILSVGDLRRQLVKATAPVVAISPLIGGHAIKGPAAELLKSQGYRADVLGVATYYQGLIDVLVIDSVDASFAQEIEAMGIQVLIQNIWMRDAQEKCEVMTGVVDHCLATYLERVS
ncbi:2-phospho-L-lactate transferase CofD family protein [Vibrio sp. PP-XX7]